MTRKTRRLAGFRGVTETFKGIRWDRGNRLWHEANKRIDPRFSAACRLDWSRVLKRPDNRHRDGRQLELVARQIGFRRVVYFVAYAKRAGFLFVISIRYADSDESALHFQHFP